MKTSYSISIYIFMNTFKLFMITQQLPRMQVSEQKTYKKAKLFTKQIKKNLKLLKKNLLVVCFDLKKNYNINQKYPSIFALYIYNHY